VPAHRKSPIDGSAAILKADFVKLKRQNSKLKIAFAKPLSNRLQLILMNTESLN
jgi:hypothetical protein